MSRQACVTACFSGDFYCVSRYSFSPSASGWFTNRDFKLAYTNPVDMSWKDGKLWVGDWFTQSIYIHDIRKTGAPIVKTYYLPDVHVTGIAVAGDRLFTSDSWAHKIRRHKFDEYLTPEKVIDSPGPSPTSLFFDGKYLWSIDSKLAKIYQHRMDDALTVIAEYKAPGAAPVGFFKDDQYAWVSDSQTRLLYKLRLDDQLSVLASYTVDALEARQEPLSCFRWVDGDLWYARDRLNIMYRRGARSLEAPLPPEKVEIPSAPDGLPLPSALNAAMGRV